ncbi:MAG: hypothetical protein ACLSAH_12955 [Bilophila wadsworthia]
MGDPIDSEMGAIGTRFKEVVEARSEGKVEVQLFPPASSATKRK